MSESFIIAAVQTEAHTLSENPSEMVLKALFAQTQVKPARVEEIHWLDEAQVSPPLQAFQFSPGLCLFRWPTAALIEHTLLQSTSRSIERGERNLVILTQVWQHHAAAVMLGSPTAIGRHNLKPHGRIALRMSLNAVRQGLFGNAAGLLFKKRQAFQEKLDAAQHRREEVEDSPDIPAAGDVNWLATAQEPDSAEFEAHFPHAGKLMALPPAPTGDLFLFTCLLHALENSRGKWGLLISQNGEGTGLGTVLEQL